MLSNSRLNIVVKMQKFFNVCLSLVANMDMKPAALVDQDCRKLRKEAEPTLSTCDRDAMVSDKAGLLSSIAGTSHSSGTAIDDESLPTSQFSKPGTDGPERSASLYAGGSPSTALMCYKSQLHTKLQREWL